MFKKSSIIYKILLIIIICFAIQAVTLSFFLDYYSNKLALNLSGDSMIGILQVISNEIDGERYEKLVNSLNNEDPYYEELRTYLEKKKNQLGLKYLYTESYRSDGVTVYVVDGNDRDSEDFSELGEEVNTEEEVVDTKDALACLDNGTYGYDASTFEDTPLLSTYYPIKNSSGHVIGMLSADFDATNIEKNRSDFKYIIIAIIIAFAVIICILLAIIMRLMLRPLFRLKASMAKLGKGDLTIEIPVETRDEIGYIIREFNHSSRSQKNIVKTVIQSSDVMNHSVIQIDANMKNLEKNTTQLLDVANDLLALGEENAASAQELNAMALTLEESVNQILIDSEKGISIVNTVGEKAIDLKDSFIVSQEKATDVFKSTQDTLKQAIEEAKSVEQIRVLAETIFDISRKTNFLAINASIEAVAAGEAGKGFAVVVDEIQSLAARSRNAVEKIQETTNIVVSSVTNLSKNTEKLLKFMEEQINVDYDEMLNVVTEYSQDAQHFKDIILGFGNISKELSYSIDTSVTAIEDISKAANDSADGIQKIVKEITSINETIVDVRVQTKESKQSSAQLLTEVQNFKVE